MTRVERVLYASGGLGVLATLAWVVWGQGWQPANAVAGVLSCAAVAAGALVRALAPASGEAPGPASGDDIEQSRVRAKGGVIGKSGRGSGGDRIRQRRVRAGGDVIGKQETPRPRPPEASP
ncbi:hypothetical protein HNR12_005495 [Streptomonospora nanhaiensis]|uniref:Uncharacterized protein n=1 Tax=Streptomonospora nanhaiensis TaxID=1323731 RepID=A0A853BVA2_9ACTN|nr:hypothetical protein [Streptomonospora nanhaiensis]NYI99218.1 hypothetical protein [Streptomonospora nanhaiensis]